MAHWLSVAFTRYRWAGMRWRLHLTEPRSGVENMALDEALLQRAQRSGECVMRVYSWLGPTLSLGRNQRAQGVFDRDRAQRANITLVRRLTGGRAVLHHREVTYSVTGPAVRGDSLRISYGAINQILLTGLRRLGIPASLAPPGSGRFPVPGSAPCFELPAAGEIMLHGRKLVGSAQLREDGAFLQHGSILLEDDQNRIGDVSVAAIPATSPAASLNAALGATVSLCDVARALFAAVRTHADPAASDLAVDDELARATDAARARYTDDLWTWRR